MIAPATRVARSGRVAERVIDGRAVVVVIDRRELHTLNGVGTFVWQALAAGPRSFGELVESVVASFEVERARAEGDVAGFVEELARLGALEVEEAA